MQTDFVNEAIKQTIAITLLSFCALVVLHTTDAALAFLLRSVWGVVNLSLIKKLLEACLSGQMGLVLGAFLIKFPLLYTAGYFAITSNIFQPAPMIAGSFLIFLSIFMQFGKKALEKRV